MFLQHDSHALEKLAHVLKSRRRWSQEFASTICTLDPHDTASYHGVLTGYGAHNEYVERCLQWSKVAGAEHSPPFSAEVQNGGAKPPLRNVSSWNSASLIKHRETSTRSRDSVVGTATGYGLDDRGVGVQSPGRVKNFLFSTPSRLALGSTKPPIQCVARALSPEVKRQRREADHSSPNQCRGQENIYRYIESPIRLHGVVLN
jgi:hypothetical protein